MTEQEKLIKKLLNKLKKANDSSKKTDIWYDADLKLDEMNEIVKKMILSLPGYYKLHSREYGTNIVDALYEIYGLFPSRLVTESMILGLQARYPDKVYASFTLGLDVITIKP